MNERERAAGAAAEQERADAVERLYAREMDWDHEQPEPRELLRYTDTDGDEIVVALDPVDDTGEDVLLVVHASQRSLAARLPMAVLRDVLTKLAPPGEEVKQ